MIGVVEGIPIRQAQFDRLAKPYFEEVRAKANRDLTPEETRLLDRNVLEELIRERLWISAARGQGLSAPVESIDGRMKQLPYFRTSGKVDESRFQSFKASPSSNYRQLASEVEQSLLLEAYVRWMERRFSPAEADLKGRFARRTTQGTIRYFWLTPEAVSTEPEASREEIRAYYERHPDEFRTPEEARITYIRFPVAPSTAASDSARTAAERAALAAARDLLRRLRAGASPEEAARDLGGANDSDWFRIGDPVRGLGRSDALMEAIRGLTPGEWTAEPIRVGPHLVLVRLDGRHEPKRRPFLEVVGLAKRRADEERQEARLDSLARADYTRRPDVYRLPRVEAVAVVRSLASFEENRPLRDRDIRRALDRFRKRAGVSDTSRAWTDSVLASLPDAIRGERRREAAWKAMTDAAKRMGRGQRPEDVAARLKGGVQRVALYRGEPPLGPCLIQGALLDSLYLRAGGAVIGPREANDSVFVVEVLQVDPAFLPPFDAVRKQARSEVLLEKRQEEQTEAESWFQSRRGEYMTPPRWQFDYVYFRKALPESVPIPVDTLRAYWEGHPLEFTVPKRIHPRHILLSTRGLDAARKEALRTKAAEILKRIRAGDDFATLAREFSEDRGSAARGGDLGWISKAEVVPEFGDAAFRLEAGQTSDLVETQYGFHIIRVEEIRPQTLRPFEECRREIQGVLGRDRADSLAAQAARSFAEKASRPGADFDSLAKPYGGVRHSPPLAARQELPGVGALDALEAEIGSLPTGGVTTAPISTSAGYLVARLVRPVPPGPATFEEVGDRVLRDRQSALRRSIADSVDARLRAALKRGADLESLLVPLGGLRRSRPFGPEGPIPDLTRDPSAARDSTFLARIFASKPGTILPPTPTSIGTLYAVIDSILPASAGEYAKARASLRREILDERIETWTARLRSRARVEIYRKDLGS